MLRAFNLQLYQNRSVSWIFLKFFIYFWGKFISRKSFNLHWTTIFHSKLCFFLLAIHLSRITNKISKRRLEELFVRSLCSFWTSKRLVSYLINWVTIKKTFHFHVATHVMCTWCFTSYVIASVVILNQSGYLLSILIAILNRFLIITYLNSHNSYS